MMQYLKCINTVIIFLLQFIIIMQWGVMRKQFDLENAQFSDESDNQIDHIPNELIQMYNKQYSLMLSQTKNFFADCKDFFSRFITLNNMGIGFNLPLMLASILKTEAYAMNPLQNSKKYGMGKEDRKQKFEQTFNQIMKKMGEVIQEMLNFQVKIKAEYLGQVFGTPTSTANTRINLTPIRPRNKTTIQNQFKSIIQKTQNPEQEQAIRNILQKNMTPNHQSQQSVCTTKNTIQSNLERLTHKIQKLTQTVKFSKQKQEKIWKIFNQKRPSRNMCTLQTSKDQPQEKQYKKLSNMLCDIVSHKNKNYYRSPYETLDSSVR